MFFLGGISRQIAIDELGVRDAPKDCLVYMEALSEGASAKKIQELNDLMRMPPDDCKRGQ